MPVVAVRCTGVSPTPLAPLALAGRSAATWCRWESVSLGLGLGLARGAVRLCFPAHARSPAPSLVPGAPPPPPLCLALADGVYTNGENGLGDLGPYNGTLTVRHLLAQSSGLGKYVGLPPPHPFTVIPVAPFLSLAACDRTR